jgi:hypothetical protein
VAAVVAVALLACGVALALALAGGDDKDGPAAASIPAGNLVPNPSFEENTSGWDVFQSRTSREQAPDAPDGEHVARVALVESPGEYSIDDEPETVSSSREGRVYTATAWVKATEANDGESVCISLRQGSPDSGVFTAASVKASAGEYRQVRVSHRASADGETIGVHVFRGGPTVREGEAFLVDAITLAEDAGPGAGRSSPECDV